jgi:hypothetical protein
MGKSKLYLECEETVMGQQGVVKLILAQHDTPTQPLPACKQNTSYVHLTANIKHAILTLKKKVLKASQTLTSTHHLIANSTKTMQSQIARRPMLLSAMRH